MNRTTVTGLVVGACVLVSGCYNGAHEYRRLRDSNAAIAGEVAYVDCGAHGLVVYSFVAKGTEHRAKAPPGLPPCETARRGDPVTVIYDPEHPEVNTLRSPQEAYEKAVGWYMPEWGFIFGPIVALVAFSIALHSRKRQAKRTDIDQGNVK